MTDDARPPISCYIRTLNEETRIAATVRAASLIAREVVVVDSESTDDTVEMAEREGARVIKQSWLGSGNQKRVGEDACQHDWLLDLDADEVVTEGLAQEIRDLFLDGKPDADVCLLPLLYVDPSGRVWRKARAPRRAKLYDRRKVRMPASGVWDQFQIPRGLRVRRLGGPLLHYPFDDIGHLSRKQGNHEARRVQYLAEGQQSSLAFKVYFGLPLFFFRNYVVRCRWREGGYGFLLSLTTAYNHWLRYAMLYERKLKGTRGSDEP